MRTAYREPSAAAAAHRTRPDQVTFVMTANRSSGRWHETIGAYSTLTGKLIIVLASASSHDLNSGYLLPDSSGRHLLVFGFGGGNTAVLDITTRRLAAVHAHYPNPPLYAAW